MATRKSTSNKQQSLVVAIPRRLISAPKSRQRPDVEAEKDSEIRTRQAYQILNNTTRNYRSSNNITQLIRHLARAEGPFSNAVHNLLQVAATSYTISAYDVNTQQFSPEGTLTAMSFLSQLDTPTNYDGYTKKQSMSGLVTTGLREVILTGAVAGELVLNKAVFPETIQLVGAETLRFLEDGKGGFYPSQQISGERDPTSLDIPTFFISSMHPDPNSVEPRSMMESAIKVMVLFEEMMEDIRRVVRTSGHNRTTVKLNAEKIKASAPIPIQKDAVKLAAYFETVRAAVQAQLEEISPEEAMVHFDSVEPDVLQSGTGTKVDYTPLLDVFIGQYSTGMKTPPSVLGLRLSSGSQGTGSVETMVFLKTARALQEPVETFFSRILTLGARLAGADVTVWFKLDAPDLRPENEQQAFFAMKQNQIFEKLSMGWLSDDEAANLLGCFPRPDGAPLLSGTMFHKKGGESPEGPTFPGDTSQGRVLQPDSDVPRKSGGKDQ